MLRMKMPRSAAAVLLVFMWGQLTSCFSERSTTEPPISLEGCNVPGGAIAANKTIVALRDYAFLPDTIRIRAGTAVVWVNCDNVARTDAHTSTSNSGAWVSPPFAEGQSYERVFTEPGVYDYHCGPHTFMRGTVIVE